MQLYLSALKGEPDPDAFSRRVALLKKRVAHAVGRGLFDQEKKDILTEVCVIPLVEEMAKRTAAVGQFFHEVDWTASVRIESKWVSATLESMLDRDWTGFAFEAEWNQLRPRPDVQAEVTLIFDLLPGSLSIYAESTENEPITLYADSIPTLLDLIPFLDDVFEPVLEIVERYASLPERS